MRKITVALSAIALALSAAALPAVAATEAQQDSVSVNQPDGSAKKRQVQRKAKSSTQARHKSKCKAGERWDATASVTAGACVKRTAKTKVKTVKKAAGEPASRQVKKKVG